MDEDTVFKTAAAVFLFVVACAAGLVPLVARSGEKVHKHGPVSSALNCAAAGILLESGLCHLLPENAQLLQDAWGARLPYAHLVCGLGFLLILVADYSAAFCADTAASSIPRSYATPTPDGGGESQPLHYQHLGGGSYAAGHRASLQPVYFTAAKARSSSGASPRCLRCDRPAQVIVLLSSLGSLQWQRLHDSDTVVMCAGRRHHRHMDSVVQRAVQRQRSQRAYVVTSEFLPSAACKPNRLM
eukprot:TRINITY_DN4046_c0_g1_i4.p2 TRINITY_DN4046_c0_g1~~TRINITY_DN4046_c0_g1_i4.p2  ORF type:complete len:243 (-),score=68.73 TRINITY_DN4046_c0_g1_i4:247-975(-)